MAGSDSCFTAKAIFSEKEAAEIDLHHILHTLPDDGRTEFEKLSDQRKFVCVFQRPEPKK